MNGKCADENGIILEFVRYGSEGLHSKLLDKTRTRSDPTAARAAGRGPINERGAAKPQSETATSTRAGIRRNTWTEKLQARTFTHSNSHTIFNESFLIKSKILL